MFGTLETDDLYHEEQVEALMEGALEHIHSTLEDVLERLAQLEGRSEIEGAQEADRYTDDLIRAQQAAIKTKLNDTLNERRARRSRRLELEARVLANSKTQAASKEV